MRRGCEYKEVKAMSLYKIKKDVHYGVVIFDHPGFGGNLFSPFFPCDDRVDCFQWCRSIVFEGQQA